MDFTTAVRSCLSQYATFSSRAHRPEYWWFFLFSILVQAMATALDALVLGYDLEGGGPIGGLSALALLLPTLAVGARRLHDTGRSAWWLLLGLIPVLGTLILIWWFTRPGEPGGNRFGPA